MSEAMPEHTNMVEVILDLKRRDPFHAFRISLASGKEYVIESGENLVEMKTEFTLRNAGWRTIYLHS